MTGGDMCADCGQRADDGQWITTANARYRLCYLCAYHWKRNS